MGRLFFHHMSVPSPFHTPNRRENRCKTGIRLNLRLRFDYRFTQFSLTAPRLAGI
jgi:hypothetical protein